MFENTRLRRNKKCLRTQGFKGIKMFEKILTRNMTCLEILNYDNQPLLQHKNKEFN